MVEKHALRCNKMVRQQSNGTTTYSLTLIIACAYDKFTIVKGKI